MHISVILEVHFGNYAGNWETGLAFGVWGCALSQRQVYICALGADLDADLGDYVGILGAGVCT